MILLGVVSFLLCFRVIYVQGKYEQPHPVTWTAAAMTTSVFLGLLVRRNWDDVVAILNFLTSF